MKRIAIIIGSIGVLALGGCGLTDTVKNSVGRVGSIIPGHDDGESAGSREGQRIYLVVEEMGKRRSAGYQVRRRSTFRGQPCLVVERVRKQELMRENVKYTTRIDTKVITSASGSALYAEERILNGDQRYTETVTIADGKALFENITPSGNRRQTLEVPRGVMFGIEPMWLVKQNLKNGSSFKQTILDRKQRKLVSESITIRGFQNETVLGREVGVWVAEAGRDGYSPQQMFFTEDGEFVRLEDEGIVVRVVTQEEAKEEQEIATIVSTVPLSFKLPAWDNFTALSFIANPADGWRKFLKDNEYIKVEDRDGQLSVTLLRTAPLVKRVSLPMTVPENIRPFLASTDQILADRREIRQQAKYIIGEEKRALQCAALLAGWVHKTVKFQPRGSVNHNPLETIRTASGDCSEHADLFASLARSIGIPTRHCQGLLIQKDQAVYHNWAEAWVGSVWVPVDTTVNRVGLPAGYLLTARGNGDGVPRDEFAWRMRHGGLSLILTKALKQQSHTVNGEKKNGLYTLIPEQKRSYVAVDGNWLANLYWGFSIMRPGAEWRGKVGLNNVGLTRDGMRISVEGVEQEYQATDSGLDHLIGSLERGMTSFRKVGAGVRSFGSKRPSKALFVDFTCVEDGQSLRCKQYLIPKRGRSYRVAAWAPASRFKEVNDEFDRIISTIEF